MKSGHVNRESAATITSSKMAAEISDGRSCRKNFGEADGEGSEF